MKLSALQKINFALSLIEISCKLINSQEEFFVKEASSGKMKISFNVESWLREMHDAVIILRQATKGKKEIIWQQDESLKERILEVKKKIHGAIACIEEKVRDVTGDLYPLYELEQVEISLLSSLECLSWGEYDVHGASPIPGVKPKKVKESVRPLPYQKLAFDEPGKSKGVLQDFFQAQKTVLKGIPQDCIRTYRKSPLTAVALTLLFPITFFIYLVVGFHECRQRRDIRHLFKAQYNLHQKLARYREGKPEKYPTKWVDRFFSLICPLASRSYDFHIRPLLKGLPWHRIGALLEYCEKHPDEPLAAELLAVFENLRVEVGQIYSGSFEEFEEETSFQRSSFDQAIKEREELVGYHLQQFENILAEFCTSIELKQQTEAEIENKKLEELYERLRTQVALSGLERVIELGLIDIKKERTPEALIPYVRQIQLMAVLQELQTPSLNLDNCPSTHEHSEMLAKLKRLRRRYYQLDPYEIDHLIEKTLDPHYILPKNLEHRLEILKISERAVPVIAHMMFQNPKFHALEFFKSSAVRWVFGGSC